MPESRDSLNGAQLSGTHAWIMAMAGQRDEALAEIERSAGYTFGNRWILYLHPTGISSVMMSVSLNSYVL